MDAPFGGKSGGREPENVIPGKSGNLHSGAAFSSQTGARTDDASLRGENVPELMNVGQGHPGMGQSQDAVRPTPSSATRAQYHNLPGEGRAGE